MRNVKLVIAGLALLFAVVAVPVVWAQGMMGPGTGWGMHHQTQVTGPVDIDQAVNLVRQALTRYGNPDLAPAEIMEFSNGFYVVVVEKSTKIGAFELLVERNGFVHPERGPNMMWNTKYGHMAGAGMMSGMGMMSPGQGMMGRPMTPGAALPQTGAAPQVTRDQARQAVQTWLNGTFAGAKAEEGVPFYGYFTFDFKRDGKVVGMASVNAFTGAVWYHTWHGTFVQEKDLE